jgi:hypothetical protein
MAGARVPVKKARLDERVSPVTKLRGTPSPYPGWGLSAVTLTTRFSDPWWVIRLCLIG